jgi:hypothetical protein
MSERSGSITLHEEIADILAERGGGWISTNELAAEVNRRGRYHKRDGSPVTPFQIHGRTRNYPHLFERDGSRVCLIATGSPAGRSQTRASTPRPATPIVRGLGGTATTGHRDDALTALTRTGSVAVSAEFTLPDRPGLYAIHADAAVWKELQLGPPPDDRPLYVGKSESSLHGRDLRTHFADGRTGSSTLRRSFAALLHDTLNLRGIPRNTADPGYYQNYGLSPADDAKLTAWMRRNIRLSVWPSPDGVVLTDLERQVLAALKPPLNLKDAVTPWSNFVAARRRVLAKEAASWANEA